ncbi:hypothetical protein [Celeribacter halophilus]|uniref:hypothetical protein n=1 Tax=Celeribacter halophilus TaxID=576117 RepID=UPI001C082921|nr:hypothetical protein [Celeribacter halophilus]MBU2889688.1 hypothetical protein [Celeribacter halophilus]MDO6510669.1 hypothetical protein [Celeribacter halophilus]
MTGFILFRNAVLRVLHHLDEALAVSGLIWIGILIIQILSFGAVDMEGLEAGDPAAVSGNGLMLLFIANLAMVIGSCWIAVEWHCYALEGKRPTSAFPSWNGKRILSYFFLSILIGIGIGMAVGLFAGVLFSLFGTMLSQSIGGLFLIVVIGLPAVFMFLRISPVLPAVALGNKLSFGDAWNATKPYSASIFQAAILSIAALIVVQFVAPVFGSGIVGLLYELAVGWLLLMVNVSLLSSIYELSLKGQLHD